MKKYIKNDQLSFFKVSKILHEICHQWNMITLKRKIFDYLNLEKIHRLT
jgi:hypothetical protein